MLFRLFVAVVCVFWIACNSTRKAALVSPVAVTEEERMTGLKTVASSDCLTCHSIDERRVGPTYLEIAHKYQLDEKQVSTLAWKIIKGGSGSWGEIPMTPHRLMSMDTAQSVVKYILSLKK